jgi:flagellar FliJ protein
MARFRFGLQAVLDLREREEKERQRVVARLESERMALENTLRGYQDALRQSKEGMRLAMGGASGGGVDPPALRLEAGAALGMQIRAHQAALRLAGVHRRLETARRALMQATKARRAIEVLKERRYAAWCAEQNRRESVALDEIGTMGAARRSAPTVGGGV